MMETFIGNVASHIANKHPKNLGEICIVTPNRRAWLYLRRQLSELIDKPAWSPTFMSIEDFANHTTGLQVLDHLSLLFEFYEVYKQKEGKKAGKLDAFIHWGKIFLNDFDEIETTLEDPAALYNYLKDSEYINTWSPDGTTTNLQRQHLEFVLKFEDWHNALRRSLLQKKCATQGMSTREAAKIMHREPEYSAYEKVFFVGFNAFTQAEEAIVSALLNKGKAEVIFDSDAYYLSDEKQEAGSFIRNYNKLWNLDPFHQGNSGYIKPKSIRILGVARSVMQAQLAGNILADNTDLTRDTSTAIVLADEGLLLPVVSALPVDTSDLNITMGYPLRQTGVASLCATIFKLFAENPVNSPKGDNRNRKHYFKDLKKLINHPIAKVYIHPLRGKEWSEYIDRSITQTQKIFLSAAEIPVPDEAKGAFFQAFPFLEIKSGSNTEDILNAFLLFCTNLQNALNNLTNIPTALTSDDDQLAIEWEASKAIEGLMLRISQLLTPYLSDLSLKTMLTICQGAFDEARLTFSGEPLKGLQIMGMLETRSLDFKNLILLSANERLIPGTKTTDSFIPFGVRQIFKMRLHLDREAIYAYNFYRLLQRAENIYLVYNTENEGLGGGEKSRYITQLEHELSKYQPQTTIENTTVAVLPQTQQKHKKIEIAKNNLISEQLQEMAAKGFSPSSLSRYIRCGLQFYFEKILKLKNLEETEESLQASTIGSVLHKALEHLYMPYKGHILTTQILDEILGKHHEVCNMAFSETLGGVQTDSGKNLLLTELTKHQLERFLVNERNKLATNPSSDTTLIDTEVVLSRTLKIQLPEKEISVKLYGMADRIDKLGETFRIIDYKSGEVTKSELKVTDLRDLTTNPNYDKAFQLMMYYWLYSKTNTPQEIPVCAIISLKKPSDWLIELKLPTPLSDEDQSDLENFQALLEELLTTLLDPNQPFSQTDDLNHCKYCDFKSVCGRYPTQDF